MGRPNTGRKVWSLYLSSEEREMLEQLRDRIGLSSDSDVARMAIRNMFRTHFGETAKAEPAAASPPKKRPPKRTG